MLVKWKFVSSNLTSFFNPVPKQAKTSFDHAVPSNPTVLTEAVINPTVLTDAGVHEAWTDHSRERVKARKRQAERMNAKLAEWISESWSIREKKENVVYCWETAGLLDIWDGERRARLLQLALPQLSLYAGSARVVGPGTLFPSLTVVVMKAVANLAFNFALWNFYTLKLWIGLNRTGPTEQASIVNSQCTTCVVFSIVSICSIVTIEKTISRGRKIEQHVGIIYYVNEVETLRQSRWGGKSIGCIEALPMNL